MGNISKSLARLIFDATNQASPGAADRLVLSPSPNTPLQTQCESIAFSDFIAAIIANLPAGYALLQKATVELTDAQIKALPTTPVQVVGAPGSGKAIVLISAVLSTVIAVDYTNFDGTFSVLRLNYGSGDASINAVAEELLTGVGAGSVVVLGSQAYTDGSTIFASSNGPGDNLALTIVAANGNPSAGNFTGGNAANTLTVTVFYTTVDV